VALVREAKIVKNRHGIEVKGLVRPMDLYLPLKRYAFTLYDHN